MVLVNIRLKSNNLQIHGPYTTNRIGYQSDLKGSLKSIVFDCALSTLYHYYMHTLFRNELKLK